MALAKKTFRGFADGLSLDSVMFNVHFLYCIDGTVKLPSKKVN